MPQINALHIVPGEQPATITIDGDNLPAVQAAVGGWLQCLTVAPAAAEPFVVAMNEEGKLMGLPANPFAQQLTTMLGLRLQPGDFLVGSILITGDVDANGSWTEVPQHVVDAATTMWADTH